MDSTSHFCGPYFAQEGRAHVCATTCKYDGIELVSNTFLKGLALALISRSRLAEPDWALRKTNIQKGLGIHSRKL